MSHHDKEPVEITVLKVIGALLLAVLAVAFGSLGACGAVLAVFSALGVKTPSDLRSLGLPLALAVGGLVVAILALWGVVMLFRKKPEE